MNRSKPYSNILFYLLCLFVLSACGGGGGGSATVDEGDKKSLTTQTLQFNTTDDITLNVGEELANPALGQGKGEVTYTSSDANTVSVSTEGTLNALTQGSATITATISEDDTYAAASQSIEVTVNALIGNTAPTISSFSPNLNTVFVSNPVQFNWNISDANSDALTCILDINSNGNTDYTIENCTSSVQSHTYTTPSSYTAKLTVSDDNGGTTEHTTTVTVQAEVVQVNRAPLINSFTATPSSSNTETPVQFNWSISDADSDTLVCKLDINNDGNVDYTIENCTSNSVQSYTYLRPGPYTAALTISDGQTTAQQATSITVTQANRAPVISSFTSSPSSINTETPVQFIWNISDADSDTLMCKLDINNDGNVDYTIENCSSNSVQSYTYARPGPYTAELTISDGKSTTQKTIPITVTQANRPPVINKLIAPTSVDTDTNVQLSWNITDADDDGIRCTVEVNSENIITKEYVDCINTIGIGFKIETPGNYTITLSAFDSYDNASEQKTASLTVTQGNHSPVINSFTSPTSQPVTNANVQFRWDISDAESDELTCTIDFDNNGTTDSTIRNCNNNQGVGRGYITAGEHTAKFTVTDINGGGATTTLTFTVLTPDTTAPEIIINGDANISLYRGSPYQEEGATATDNRDPEVTVSTSGSVDTTTLGDYTITYNATDQAGNTATITRTITVIPAPFITTWKTDNEGSTNDNQIKIGTNGSGYNYQVDWGDDSISENVTGDITHTYTDPGTYTISINGSFPQMYFSYNDDNQKLLSIERWGDINWQSMKQAFYYCKNMVSNATDIPNLTDVQDMSYMFTGTVKFNQNISQWDVSSVTSMRNMFSHAGTFNQDISNWDVSSVTDMHRMFEYTEMFDQYIGSWNVSSVLDMSYMFNEATSFNQNVGNWNVSSVKNLSAMFNSAHSFNQELNNWNTSQVTHMNYMFYDASRFNQSLNNWDVSSVIYMHGMFYGATDFNQGIGGWNVSSVTDMNHMFTNAEAFNQDISDWNVSSVTDMHYMFTRAFNFDQDIGSWNVSSVTRMNSMFEEASTFNQDIGQWDVSLVNEINKMFHKAEKFNQNIGNWDVSSIISFSYMFANASDFNQDLSSWDVSSATELDRMFSQATSFDHSVSSWDVSSVTDFNLMFYNAIEFNQNLSTWDVSSATNLSSIFSHALAFNQDISSWDTSSVMYMGGMFYGAEAFNQDLRNWDVSSVTSMNLMFHSAISFNQSLDDWDVSSVDNMHQMFNGASSFDQSLGNWDVSSVTDMYYMFESVTLSTENYDSTLIGWSQKSLQNYVSFTAGNSQYSSSSKSARDVLTKTYNWNITDGGLDQPNF